MEATGLRKLSDIHIAKIVLNSLGYLGQIAEKFVFTNTIMDMIGTALMEKATKAVINAKPEE